MKAYTKNPELLDSVLSLLERSLDWFLVIALLVVTCLVCCSCGSTKEVTTIPVETIKEVTKTDTVYLNAFRFDSTYVSHDLLTDRSRDTLFIRETNTIYKYKLLRDTVERVKIETIRDSIPYEVCITEVKEVPRKRTWMDHLCYTITGIVSGLILVFFLRKFKILKL